MLALFMQYVVPALVTALGGYLIRVMQLHAHAVSSRTHTAWVSGLEDRLSHFVELIIGDLSKDISLTIAKITADGEITDAEWDELESVVADRWSRYLTPEKFNEIATAVGLPEGNVMHYLVSLVRSKLVPSKR